MVEALGGDPAVEIGLYLAKVFPALTPASALDRDLEAIAVDLAAANRWVEMTQEVDGGGNG